MNGILFNRNPLKYGRKIEQPNKELVKNTIGLFRASMEDATKFGGDLTREALKAIQLTNKRKYVVVDTKIHMLMPQFLPSIPGWHTDGVPRPEKDKPDIRLQEDKPENIYHLLVTGDGCLTEFINEKTIVNLPNKPTSDLYKRMDKEIETVKKEELRFGNKNYVISAPSCQVVTWDWWNIHRAIQATKHEWRFLIRVAETNYLQPNTDLKEVLRTQQQVYVPLNFGW